MGTVTVRQLDEETKRRLRIQAAHHGHSMEQEARNILQAALAPGPSGPSGPSENWVDQLLLKTMKTDVTRNIVRLGWPIMGLSAFIPEIEKSAIDATNADLADYGL